MKRMLLTMVAILALASAASAAPPQVTNVQGSLLTPSGTAVPDGSYTITFRLYTVPVAGAAIWAETQNLQVEGSIFNAILGNVSPLTLSFDSQYWLGVTIQGDPEMSPRIPLTSVPYAFNVVNGKVVKSINGLHDDVTLQAGANINISTLGQVITISGTGAGADNDWTISGSNQYSAVAGNVGIGTATPAEKLHVTNGNIGVGTANASSYYFNSYHAGTTLPSSFGGDHSGEGGQLQLYSETGDRTVYVQPDIDGTGGFLGIYRSDTSVGFTVDGNSGGEEPVVRITGSGQNATFDMGATGDATVQLPVDALDRTEILDEPGAASNDGYAFSSLVLTSTATNILSRTITCPTAGYVLVMGQCEVELNHTNGAISYSMVGVSDASATFPGNQDITAYLPGSAATGLYLVPSSCQLIYPVSAGTHTFYLVGREGAGNIEIWDAQLDLVFLPTAYGLVVTPSKMVATGDQFTNRSSEPAPTEADLAAERAESEAFYRQQVEAEMDAMRAQLASIQSKLDQLNEK